MTTEAYVSKWIAGLDPLWLVVLMAILLALLVMELYINAKLRKKVLASEKGEKKPPMISKREREAQVKQTITDIIVHGMLDKRAAGELSLDEYNQWVRVLSNVFNLKEALPKGDLTLKERLLRKHKPQKVKMTVPPEIMATSPAAKAAGTATTPSAPPKKSLALLAKQKTIAAA